MFQLTQQLDYWEKRFDRLNVKHSGIKEQFGKKTLSFVDFDDQHYQLISDEKNEGVSAGTPWQKGPIPLDYAITGLGPIFVRIANFDYFKEMMEKVLLFKEIAQEGAFHLFEVGEGGNGAQVVVEYNAVLPQARQGFGTVHHAAFRVEDRSVLEEWDQHMHNFGLQTSGFVDRYFFGALYSELHRKSYLNFQQMALGLWETNLMKRWVKNYPCLHFSNQNVNKLKN